MNYAAIYARLIARRLARRALGYTERHHIVPRCVGGTDDPSNIVRLTPEEHYAAHQLLVKMYPGNEKLVYAAVLMSAGRDSNKTYGWLKRRISVLRSTPHSLRHRANLSKAWLSRATPSAATRARTSASMKGRVKTPEHCAKISAAKRGKQSPAAYAASLRTLQFARQRRAEKRAGR